MALKRPKAALANGPHLRALVDDVIRRVAAELPELTSTSSELPRHFAGTALARSARLVSAMVLLRERGMEDVSELPFRQVAEHFTLGMYLLYGGDTAFEHARGGYVYDLSLLDTGDEPRPRILDTWTGPRDRLKWQDLMLNVVPKLVSEARNDADAPLTFRQLYNQIYRGQTIFVDHAGIPTLNRHNMIEDDGTRTIDEIGYTPDDGTGAIVFSGMLTALLAVHVFESFGRPADLMERLYRELQKTGELIPLPDV